MWNGAAASTGWPLIARAKTDKSTRVLWHAVERIGEEEVLLGVAAEQV